MPKRNMTKTKTGMQAILFYILLILFWQGVFSLGTGVLDIWKSYAFPSPLGVVNSFVYLVESGDIGIAILSSLRRCIMGFAISLVIGAMLGILITASGFFKRNLKPLLMGIQTLPSICWVPFAILWFGLNESAVIFVVVMGSVFSVAIGIEDAFSQVPVIYLKAAKTMGTGRRDLYRHVLFPAALPGIVSGLKQSWSFAWRALMSGEVMSSFAGLGYSLMTGRDMADINQVMAVMIIIVVLGILIEKFVFGKVERRILKKRGL